MDTPGKINMEPEPGPLEDCVHFQPSGFQVPVCKSVSPSNSGIPWPITAYVVSLDGRQRHHASCLLLSLAAEIPHRLRMCTAIALP